METKYIIMSGEERPFVAESPDYKPDNHNERWWLWYYQSGAYPFDSKEEAHEVASQLNLRQYSLLETFTVVSLVPA